MKSWSYRSRPTARATSKGGNINEIEEEDEKDDVVRLVRSEGDEVIKIDQHPVHYGQ